MLDLLKKAPPHLMQQCFRRIWRLQMWSCLIQVHGRVDTLRFGSRFSKSRIYSSGIFFAVSQLMELHIRTLYAYCMRSLTFPVRLQYPHKQKTARKRFQYAPLHSEGTCFFILCVYVFLPHQAPSGRENARDRAQVERSPRDVCRSEKRIRRAVREVQGAAHGVQGQAENRQGRCGGVRLCQAV